MTMEQHNPALLTVTGEEAGGKLIRFLERRLEGNFPPAMFHKWIRTGQVRVNGKRAKPFLPLGAGDQVRLPPFALARIFTGAEGLIPAPAEGSPLGGDAAPGSDSRHVPLPSLAPCAPVGTPFLGADVPVVAMTADMLVVAKPAGLAVQGGSALTDSLVQRLADAYTHQPFTPAPVHRLDRATSGLVVIGMTHAGLQRLSALFATPQGVQKEYLAVVHGHWPHAPCVLSDTVEKREEKGFERMAVVRGGGMLAVPPEAARGLFPLDGGAMHLEDQEAVRSRVTTALAYPSLMVVVGIGVMLFLLAFVIPKIVVIFEQNKAALPLITVLLIKTSTLLRSGWWALLILGGGLVYLYRRLIRRESFRFKRDAWLLKLPLVGPLAVKLILSRFSRILGLLLSSGVPVIRALEITGEVVVNRRYRTALAGARLELAEGGSLSASLRDETLFPPLLVHMVAVGERGGTLEAMLSKAGAAFEKEFVAAVARVMSLLEPLLVLAMGLVVGTMVIAVLLPIFQLNQLIK